MLWLFLRCLGLLMFYFSVLSVLSATWQRSRVCMKCFFFFSVAALFLRTMLCIWETSRPLADSCDWLLRNVSNRFDRVRAMSYYESRSMLFVASATWSHMSVEPKHPLPNIDFKKALWVHVKESLTPLAAKSSRWNVEVVRRMLSIQWEHNLSMKETTESVSDTFTNRLVPVRVSEGLSVCHNHASCLFAHWSPTCMIDGTPKLFLVFGN